MDPLATILIAVGAFAGTNIDDLLLVTALFLASRSGGRPRAFEIVGGQYLGFAGLLAISATAAIGLLAVPVAWVGVLGVVPLFLGLHGLWRARRASWAPELPPLGASGLLPVASITIANGGDNVAVYTTLFRTQGGGEGLVSAAVFLALLGVWCIAGRQLGGHRAALTLGRARPLLVPIVYIAIGVRILVGSGVLTRLAAVAHV